MGVRSCVLAFPTDQKLTILLKGKPSYHDDLREADDHSLLLYEVDEKRISIIGYEDVKKVRRGYGGYNSVTGQHVDPLHSRIAVIAVVGGLVAIMLAVALAKD